jgi:hypothetical protein
VGGRDLNDSLVRTTRVRLALLASVRHGRRSTLGERELARLLPEIRKGDGQALDLEHPTLVLLNPPFGSTLTRSAGWVAVVSARCRLYSRRGGAIATSEQALGDLARRSAKWLELSQLANAHE